MEIKWVMIANSVIWLATSIAIIGAVYITKEPRCLWAFVIPAMSGYSFSNKTK